MIDSQPIHHQHQQSLEGEGGYLLHLCLELQLQEVEVGDEQHHDHQVQELGGHWHHQQRWMDVQLQLLQHQVLQSGEDHLLKDEGQDPHTELGVLD